MSENNVVKLRKLLGVFVLVACGIIGGFLISGEFHSCPSPPAKEIIKTELIRQELIINRADSGYDYNELYLTPPEYDITYDTPRVSLFYKTKKQLPFNLHDKFIVTIEIATTKGD